MVSMTEIQKMHGSEESAARLKKRKFAQLRLQIYGIIAISLAGAALIALLWSVVGKATGALTESYINLPILLEQAEIDPDETADPSIIGRANYGGLVKDMLKAEFPFVTGRSEKREMYDIISGGAAYELREEIVQNPSMIGREVDFSFLGSDVTDLYIKGSYGTLESVEHSGAITIEEDGKNVVITSDNSDFDTIVSLVREDLLALAAFNRDQASLQENGRLVFSERAEEATTEDERIVNSEEAGRRAAERDRLLAVADKLEAQSNDQTLNAILDKNSPSAFIKVGETWIKLSEVSASKVTGRPLGELMGVDGSIANSEWALLVHKLPESRRKVSDVQIILIERLKERGVIETVFNKRFFTAGDSREPELAGIWGAVVGTFWTMLVTIMLAFPVGVLAAIYLEEFAKKGRITDFIEVNINNLAAVPSIVFGLLGLAVFLGVFGVPRSAPVAGGIVLAIMTLPTIIIAARAAIKAVPPSIRDAALGLGASQLQTSFHHVLPLAMPGILTGTIIGMAQALGETAPLIMIGMVAFIVDIPTGVYDSASVLPVQIFRWSDFPERAFEAKTAATIVVLLLFLILMNGLAVFLRKRFERRW